MHGSIRILLIVVAAVFAFSAGVAAQDAGQDVSAEPGNGNGQASDSYEVLKPEVMHIDAVASLACVVQLPDNFDPERSYPLVIGLHGYGANPDRYLTNWYAFDSPEFIYAVPQAPYAYWQGTYLGYSWWLLGADDPEQWRHGVDLSQDYVLGVVDELTSQYNVSSIYALGFSQGAVLGYVLGIKHFDVFSGVACITGWLEASWLTDSELAQAADGLRVFIAHGSEDPALPLNVAHTAHDILSGHGYDVELHEFPCDTHTMTSEILQLVEDWVEGDELP
jgi:phospholipase/carboxylesterase